MAKASTLKKESKKVVPFQAFHQTKEFKTAFKFTAKPKGLRPMLEGVHVLEGGLVATDALRAIYIEGKFPGAKVGNTYDKNGGLVEKGNYPNILSVFTSAEKKIKHTFEVDVKEWLGAHDLLNVLAKEQNTDSVWMAGKRKGVCHHKVTLLTEDGKLKLHSTDGKGNSGKYILVEKVKKSLKIKISYNATFMMDALKAMKDLEFKQVEIGLGDDALDVMVLKAGNVKALVLPVRN